MLKSTYQQKVRFFETDGMGIVWHGRYIEWFEASRLKMLEDIGLSYKTLIESGYQLPLLEVHLQYIKPAHFNDLITVESRVETLPKLKMTVEYTVYADDTIVCKGCTVHVFVNKELQPVRAPKVFLQFAEPFFK